MKLLISNKLALTEPPLQIKSHFINALTFANPLYEEAVKHGRYTGRIRPTIDMYTDTPYGLIVPRGVLQTIEDNLLNKGFIEEVSDERILLEPMDIDSKIILRDYQQVAKHDILRHPNGVLVAPAGSGKTIMGIDLIATLRQKAIWITHTKRLLDQAIDRITATTDIPRKEIGIIGKSKWSVGERITVALVQTLVRNQDKLLELGREFGLVIVDECHHIPSTTFTTVLGYFYAYYIIGATATPYRRDHLENLMFAAIGNANAKIHRSIVQNAGGTMVPSVIVRNVPSPMVDHNDYHSIIEDYVLPNKIRSSMIAADVIREAKLGNYCIVICTRKSYCELLYDLIYPEWKKTGVANGDKSDKHNKEQISMLENDLLSVLITTFEMLGEGFDVPKLNRGFIALPFRERVRVEQAVGRIQRTCEGKYDSVLYDYVDTNIGILNAQFRTRTFVYRLLGMEVQ